MADHNKTHELLAQLLWEWLEDRTGNPVRAAGGSDPYRVVLGETVLALQIETASSAEPDASWFEATRTLAFRVAERAAPAALIWLPAGFALPEPGPAETELVDVLQRQLGGMVPGEQADALLPVTLRIQKRDEDGAYVSASGGMAQHWARFTDRVKGYYQIDAAALHRPPVEGEDLDSLIDSLVQASRGLSLGETARVSAHDRLRVQRLRGGEGCAVIGTAPNDETEQGAPLRRRLRILLRETVAAPGSAQAELRALLIAGHFPSTEGEPVGPALRGQDPALFAGIDLIVLAAEGTVKLLLDVTRRAELQAGDPPAGAG